MAQIDSISIGITFASLGVIIFLLTLYIARILPKKLRVTPPDHELPITIEIQNHNEGIIITAGGRIAHINAIAQEWFGIDSQEANLERLARQARPAEAFLNLCAADGLANFSLDGHLVEGTSFSIPGNKNQARAIILRRPKFVIELENGEPSLNRKIFSDQIFNIFIELSQSVFTHQGLDSTLKIILTLVERLLPADFVEINLLDAEKKYLVPYRLTGAPDVDLQLSKGEHHYVLDQGITGYLISKRQPVIIADRDDFHELRPVSDHQPIPFRSYLAAPLIVADELIGTLEISSLTENTYSSNDLELLRMFSEEAAVAVHNARLHEKEQQQATEVTGLANLAQAVSSLNNTQALYTRLIESIELIFEANILGFLVYDENHRTLEGQAPFKGLPASIVEWAATSIEPETEADWIWSSQKAIVATDAPMDPSFQALGLDHLAQAAGMRHCALVPLTSSGRSIGYLQAANKPDGTAFEPTDLNLLSTFAVQAGPIIENAVLVQQSQRRARRAETLRRIANLTASNATLDEILKYSLQDLARLLEADQAAIYLFDEQDGELRLHNSSILGISSEIVPRITCINMNDSQFGHTVTGSMQYFSSNHLLKDPSLPPVYQPLIDTLDVQSVIVAPLTVRNQGIGEMMIASCQQNYFHRNDVQTVLTAAAQIASAVEHACLASQANEDLQRCLDQLASMARIGLELNNEPDLHCLLQRVYEEALNITRADCGTIFLFEGADTNTDPNNGSQAQKHIITLQIGEPHAAELLPFEETVLETREALVIADSSSIEIQEDAASNHKSSICTPAHEDVRSSLIVPITSQGQVAGMLHLHARSPHGFDESDKEIAEALAIQAALAVGNVNLRQEQTRLAGRIQRFSMGMEIAGLINSQVDRASLLQVFGRELLNRMNLEAALVVEPSPQGLHLLCSLGQIPKQANIEALLGQRNPLTQCLQSGAQYLVARLKEHPEWLVSPLLQAFQVESFICLPIQTGKRLDAAILWISKEPRPSFSPEDEQFFAMLAMQVAIALQNLNVLTETNQRLAEANMLLDFSRQIGSLESDHISQALLESAQHLVTAAQAGIVFLWQEKEALLVPRSIFGYADGTSLQELTLQTGEGLPGQAFIHSSPLRIDEVDFVQQYQLGADKLLVYREGTSGRLPQSALAVPIEKSPSSGPLGVILLENFSAPTAFTAEDQDSVSSLAQQTALIMENTRLYQAAQERANQMQSLTKVATIISSNLHTDQLIDSLLDQMQSILPYKTGTLWLRQEDRMIVHAVRGFSDEDRRVGLSTAIEDSELLKAMIASGLPLSVGDVRADARFPKLDEPYNYSWLGLPLIASGTVTGVIALEMEEPDYYTPEHIQIATTFASQAAVAIENANLYQQSVDRAAALDQRSQRLEMLNRLSTAFSQSLDLDNLLKLTFQELGHVIQYSYVSAIFFNISGAATLYAEMPDSDPKLPTQLPDARLFERLRQTFGILKVEDTFQENDIQPLLSWLEKRHTRSLLALSLATGNELLGILLLHTDQPHHFTEEELNLARTISNQAAVAIQNARLYAETRSLTEELDRRVQERTEQLSHEAQRTKTLLKIITELSASLDLAQVLNRTLQVLNEVIGAETVSVLIDREGEQGLQQLASIGDCPWLAVYHDTIKEVIHKQEPLIIKDTSMSSILVGQSETTIANNSVICAPLSIGEEPLGAILFTHSQSEQFSPDHMDLIQAAANQIAIAVNNAELFNLIRDQAEDMGKMARHQQIEAQRTLAILEDVADGVLVTDGHMSITLFNDSAEKMLGLKRASLLGKPLEHFSGLFGREARSWMETIRTWSQSPSTYRSGETFAEQITLEDGHVISVHLAPVDLDHTFLGTVSVFRDITHQIELDRLKSEFVATVSHELRTPMTSIKGYIDILLMGAAGSLNEQQTNFLEIVKNNSERLSILVQDLLDISRIEAKELNLSMQPLDLTQVAEPAIEELKKRAQNDSKAMDISIERPRRLPRVVGDAERVRQILDNLLENAYLYTPEGGSICLQMHPIDHAMQIDVIDDGIGIPAEIQERVFERFFRGEHAFVLASAGTGLGLSIVQHLVDLHNGRIWLESSGIPGEGSTFSFTLPVYTPKG